MYLFAELLRNTFKAENWPNWLEQLLKNNAISNLQIITRDGLTLNYRFFKPGLVSFSILERILRARWAIAIWRIHKIGFNACLKSVYNTFKQ